MDIQYIVIHHSAVSRDKNPDQFIANNNYHKSKGFPLSSLGYYLGYNYEISSTGIVRQARKEGEIGAHTVGLNDMSIGICMDGEFDTEIPTEQQTEAMSKLLKEILTRHPKAKITYHRNWAKKTCPGLLIKDDWAINLINQKKMKLIRERGRKETYIVINGKNYYIRNTDTFNDLNAEKLADWGNVEEVDGPIEIQGIIAG